MPRIRLHLVLLLLFACAAGLFAAPSSTSLDGVWQLLPDAQEHFSTASLPSQGWRAVRVPLSVQLQFPDLRDFAGVVWYRRSFTAPHLQPGEHLMLRFAAVDDQSTLFINGVEAGAHEGGYTPFTIDITSLVHPGPNTLLLKVADPPGPPAQRKASYRQIPHGKQDWYVQTTGIWQPVTLEVKPSYFIRWAHALTQGDHLQGFRLGLEHADRIPAGAHARIVVTRPGHAPIVRNVPLPSGQQDVTLPFALDHAALWSPAHPVLYRFRITLPDSDSTSDAFGFRTFTARDGHLYLNGQPFYMRAALDQNFFNQGGYAPPSLEYLVHEFREARRLGLNLLRCHIQIPDPRYLEAADETGLLVWYEIPNWDDLTPASEAHGKTTLEAMIQRDWNHPSIVIQSIINESWGANLTRSHDRQWVNGMYGFAKQHLPQRLIDDNSACCKNFHIQSDLADFHQYFSIPDHAAQWDAWVKDFASRPSWLFSPYGDAKPTGQEPLIVSEFGNWGLPQLPVHLPWWFDRDFNGNPITQPGGVFARMKQAGLGRIFSSYNAMAAATQQHEWESLRDEIETMRLQPAIQGYVITEFTDLNWESNGLLTMWRQPKVFAPELAALQQPIIAVARAARHDDRPGEKAEISLSVSNESAATLTGAKLRIAGHLLPVPPVAPGAVVSLGTVQVPLQRATTGIVSVAFDLLAADGHVLNHRTLPLAVIAAAKPAGAAIQLDTSLQSLQQPLAAEGFRTGHTGVLLTAQWNDAARRAAEKGATVIVLAGAADALPSGSVWKVIPRAGDLSGDWISNFNWLDTSRAPFSAFASLGSILGWPAAAVTPQNLLDAPAGASSDTLAGFFLGWVHDSHPVAVQARHGQGKVIVTTLNLAGTYGKDPLATAMLDRLIAYINSPSCQPTTTLP